MYDFQGGSGVIGREGPIRGTNIFVKYVIK